MDFLDTLACKQLSMQEQISPLDRGMTGTLASRIQTCRDSGGR